MKDHQQPYHISNCAYDAQCKSSWQELSPTAELNIRYCPKCDNHIHLCATLEEVIQHARLDNAVAISKRSAYPTGPSWCQ